MMLVPFFLALSLPAQAHEPADGHVREENLCTTEALERLATETNHASGATGSLATSHTLLAVDKLDGDGVVLHPGDKIRVKKRAGTAKAWSTGHAAEVNIDAGRTGVVRCFTDSQIGKYNNQLVVVRWDLQVWTVFDGDGPPQLVLQPFESTVHPSYVEVVKAPEAPTPPTPPTP